MKIIYEGDGLTIFSEYNEYKFIESDPAIDKF